MQMPATSTLAWLLLVPLIAWRVVARFRRMVGRQRLSRIRPWITLAIFPTLLLALALAAPQRLPLLLGAVLAGCVLGVFGLRRTTFQPTKQGLYYIPNAPLGIALSLLFLARILYRVVEVWVLEPQSSHGMHDFARSPVTLAVFGLLAGYYIAYAVGLVRWRWGVLRAKAQREAAQAAAPNSDESAGPSDLPHDR